MCARVMGFGIFGVHGQIGDSLTVAMDSKYAGPGGRHLKRLNRQGVQFQHPLLLLAG